MSLFQKLSYYSLSMWAYYLIVLLLSIKSPELQGNKAHLQIAWTFIKQNWVIADMAALLLIIDVFLFVYICYYLWEGQTHSPITVEYSESRNFDYLTLAVSILTPLVSFSFIQSPIRSGIVLLVMYVLFGIIYIKGELYYANSSLILFGIKLYKINGTTIGGHEKSNIMTFSHHRLKKGDSFSYVKISEEVFYAKKMGL